MSPLPFTEMYEMLNKLSKTLLAEQNFGDCVWNILGQKLLNELV